MIMVSPTNYKSLLAEHRTKHLSTLLGKHLSEVWSWPDCFPYAKLCYNSFSTPNLDNMSPYELVFGHGVNVAQDLERNKAKCSGKWNFWRLLCEIEEKSQIHER